MKPSDLIHACLEIADDPATSREQMVGVLRLALKVERSYIAPPEDALHPAYAHLKDYRGTSFIRQSHVDRLTQFYNERNDIESAGGLGRGKIAAIKWLRGETGCGLKEAKDAVEVITKYVW